MMRYDTVAINQKIDLLSLLEGNLKFKKKANSHGGEYSSPCPNCTEDGKNEDRFVLQPFAQNGGRWMCRQCHPKWGRAIDFIMHYEKLDFKAACEKLGGKLMDSPSEKRIVPTVPTSTNGYRLIDDAPPSAEIQASAKASLAVNQKLLCNSPKALAYIANRGISLEVAQKAGLGLSKDNEFILLPYLVDDTLWSIRKRAIGDVPKEKRYSFEKKAGSGPCGALFNANALEGKTTIVICEGELNALALQSVAPDHVAVVSPGSISDKKFNKAMLPLLARKRFIFFRFDGDTPGQEAQTSIMSFLNGTPLPWPFPEKDPCDVYAAGHDLAAYLREALAVTFPDVQQKEKEKQKAKPAFLDPARYRDSEGMPTRCKDCLRPDVHAIDGEGYGYCVGHSKPHCDCWEYHSKEKIVMYSNGKFKVFPNI